MKAAIYTKYGPPEVLRISEVNNPVPKRDEVLIKVYAATVNRSDTGFRSAQYFVSRFFTGLITPKKQIGGSEFAGKIVEVGIDVKDFKPGDKVFGFDDIRGSAHAEYMTEHATGPMAIMPERFDYEEMAPAGEGAIYALSDIRAAGVRKGHNVMVYGASGAIGLAAVQIMKHLGARVTAVCGTKNVELVKKLGADTVIDYQTQDFTDTDDMFDFIFDAVGKTSYGVCKNMLSQTGCYCSTELGKGGQNPLLAIWFTLTGSRKVIFPIPKIDKEKIQYIKQLVEAGEYKPVVDRTYLLDEIVEASRYVESGQKVGSVVIKIV